jgi:hypothetical protein
MTHHHNRKNWMPLVLEIFLSESQSTSLDKLNSYVRPTEIPSSWLGAQLYTLYGFNALYRYNFGE